MKTTWQQEIEKYDRDIERLDIKQNEFEKNNIVFVGSSIDVEVVESMIVKLKTGKKD